MLSDKLLTWYEEHARDLPWRRTDDPYAIWVSEIMLQQTRVETVLPYYQRFMGRFPDIQTLAASAIDEVLMLWEGLGYYARARNLHRAARIVVELHEGNVPESTQALRKLPGVGKYTADALQSIAFQRDRLALEGNLRRVLTRLYDVHLDPRRPEGEREIRRLGMSLLPPGRASEFNQAMMDLGALICTPRAPACRNCPLVTECLAFRSGTQEALPIRQSRRPLPMRFAVAGIIQENGSVLITRHTERGLLGGLWGFPSGFVEQDETNPEALRRVIKEQLGLEIQIIEPLPALTHTYTHFSTALQPYTCRVQSSSMRERADVRWVLAEQLEEFAMGKLDRMLANEIIRAPAE